MQVELVKDEKLFLIVYFQQTCLQVFRSFNRVFQLCISDPPALQLKWGNGIKARHIRQGNDVYFECIVTSNPVVENVEWYHGV